MDLFSDLPTPSKDMKLVPPHRRTLLPNSGTDLFGDLPSPSSQVTDQNIALSNEPEKNLKRKIDDMVSPSNSTDDQNELFVMHGFVAERKGEREEMQDAHFVIDDFKKRIETTHSSIKRLSLYGVFDGHAGCRASKYSAEHIPSIIAAKFPKGDVLQVERDVKKCFVEAFKKADDEFLKEAAKNKPSWKDGTTCAVLLAVNNTLYIANLGDSKAVLCRYSRESGGCVAVPLSKDHSPTDYSERMRIQKAGGYVKDGRVLGSLEVSRSIGDGQFKTFGVICVPDIRRCQLQGNDRFLVLACDGLWKVFTSEQVLQIINNNLEDLSIETEELRCESACTKLVNEAVRKLSGDNVTVIILLFKKSCSSIKEGNNKT